MNKDLIFDVGMNNGDDTAYYLHEGFRVVAIEADPQLAERGAKRFGKEIDAGDLTILNVGVAAEEGELPFWVCDSHTEWSSFDRSIASRDNSPHHQVNVPCRRFSSILKEFGVPHYAKIDIEGNDRLCVQDLTRETLPHYISVEADGVGLLDSLAEVGYTRFKCISQIHYLPLELPPTRQQIRYTRATRVLRSRNVLARAFKLLGGRPMLRRIEGELRRRDGWTFPGGASGPFGGKLPGRWQSHREMRETYRKLQEMRAAGKKSPFWNEKEYSFWADFHASR